MTPGRAVRAAAVFAGVSLGLALGAAGCSSSGSGSASGPGSSTPPTSSTTSTGSPSTAALCTPVTADGTTLSLRLPRGWAKGTDLGAGSGPDAAHLATDLQLDRQASGTFTDLVSIYTSTHKGQVSAAELRTDVAGVLQSQHDRLGRQLLSAAQVSGQAAQVAGRDGLTGSFTDAHPNQAVRSSYHWWAVSSDRVVFTVVLTEAASGPSAANTVGSGLALGAC